MSLGKMTLHRFNGDEIYNVESATIEHNPDEEGLSSVTFRAEAGTPPLQTLPDTAPLHAQPSAEWTVTLPKIPALSLKVGCTFKIPKGYNERTHDDHTTFYYCELDTMDDNLVEILARDGRRVRARLTGMTMDVNFYDGSKPPTKVVVEAEFTLGL